MLHIPDAAVHVPPVQEGEVREFPSNRDVLGLAREWRREKSRRPFSPQCHQHWGPVSESQLG